MLADQTDGQKSCFPYMRNFIDQMHPHIEDLTRVITSYEID